MQYISVTLPDPLAIISTVEIISLLVSHSEMTNKRTFSDAMETEQEDNSQTSKKQKTKDEGELVEVTNSEGNKKQMKLKGPTFEIK